MSKTAIVNSATKFMPDAVKKDIKERVHTLREIFLFHEQDAKRMEISQIKAFLSASTQDIPYPSISGDKEEAPYQISAFQSVWEYSMAALHKGMRQIQAEYIRTALGLEKAASEKIGEVGAPKIQNLHKLTMYGPAVFAAIKEQSGGLIDPIQEALHILNPTTEKGAETPDNAMNCAEWVYLHYLLFLYTCSCFSGVTRKAGSKDAGGDFLTLFTLKAKADQITRKMGLKSVAEITAHIRAGYQNAGDAGVNADLASLSNYNIDRTSTIENNTALAMFMFPLSLKKDLYDKKIDDQSITTKVDLLRYAIEGYKALGSADNEIDADPTNTGFTPRPDTTGTTLANRAWITKSIKLFSDVFNYLLGPGQMLSFYMTMYRLMKWFYLETLVSNVRGTTETNLAKLETRYTEVHEAVDIQLVEGELRSFAIIREILRVFLDPNDTWRVLDVLVRAGANSMQLSAIYDEYVTQTGKLQNTILVDLASLSSNLARLYRLASSTMIMIIRHMEYDQNVCRRNIQGYSGVEMVIQGSVRRIVSVNNDVNTVIDKFSDLRLDAKMGIPLQWSAHCEHALRCLLFYSTFFNHMIMTGVQMNTGLSSYISIKSAIVNAHSYSDADSSFGAARTAMSVMIRNIQHMMPGYFGIFCAQKKEPPSGMEMDHADQPPDFVQELEIVNKKQIDKLLRQNGPRYPFVRFVSLKHLAKMSDKQFVAKVQDGDDEESTITLRDPGAEFIRLWEARAHDFCTVGVDGVYNTYKFGKEEDPDSGFLTLKTYAKYKKEIDNAILSRPPSEGQLSTRERYNVFSEVGRATRLVQPSDDEGYAPLKIVKSANVGIMSDEEDEEGEGGEGGLDIDSDDDEDMGGGGGERAKRERATSDGGSIQSHNIRATKTPVKLPGNASAKLEKTVGAGLEEMEVDAGGEEEKVAERADLGEVEDENIQ